MASPASGCVTARAIDRRSVSVISTGSPRAALARDADINRREESVFAAIAAAADQDRPAHPELPGRADASSGSGVTKGGPTMVAYATPYDWFDAQAARRDQDGNW